MGLLFHKKYCDLCGGKIGLFGSQKLKDGILCKACTKKLSPWFSDYQNSTVDAIREQLADREHNRELFSQFRVTRRIGTYRKVFLDEDAGQFLVATDFEFEHENPDVLPLQAVKDCQVKILDTHSELYYRDNDGDRHAYDPPKYVYRYRFEITIAVEHPYFDVIQFYLNKRPLEIEYTDCSLSGNALVPERDAAYRQMKQMAQQISEALHPVPPLRSAGCGVQS